MSIFKLCGAVLAAVLSVGASAADCKQLLNKVGPNAMQLGVAEFDESEVKGWRALQDQKCYAEAAQLIEYFALRYDSDYRRLKWHLAQMHALAGNPTVAIAAARLSISPVQAQMHPDFDWNDYVLATVAFLQKDRATFDIHRAALKVIAPKNPLNAANVAFVDRLSQCFDKPYVIAHDCGVAP